MKSIRERKINHSNEKENKTHNEMNDSNKSKIKPLTNIKYLRDNSYDLFNEIFSSMEFENIQNEKIKINDYNDFYNFQLNLNANYKPSIKFFDYENKLNVNIVKEIPYKSTKLRKLHEEDGAIIISPNGHFVRTSEIKINSNSSLERYNTVIANSLILKGVYYYEIKILELGNNSDICFGIIGKDCDFMNNKRYKNFPLCEFEDCYGFNLNNCFNDRAINPSNHLKVGTVISIKVDLNKNKIFIYFNGENLGNNSINIKNSNLGYYPAFSLSSGKEIQVRFGGIYNLFLYFKTSNQIDAKPICQYNNLENIVSCYMEIVDKCLIKIMNHKQISFNESIRFFYPMITFFANIAFNDEYIMKQYILKYMYKNYLENKDIEIFFNVRYIFLYLIITNIDKSKQQESILFLLNCLSEDIKNYSYITSFNNKIPTFLLLIKLYNYFLNRNLFREILFPEGIISDNVSKKIKLQIFYIFQSIKITGNEYSRIFDFNIMELAKEKMKKFINNKYYIECFSDLIETLLGLNIENSNIKTNKISELLRKQKIRDNENSPSNQSNNKKYENNFDYEILENYLSNEKRNNKVISKDNEALINNRKIENNSYRQIFFELINDGLENKSKYNIYNLISTIYLPLINLFNKCYEEENFYNYSNKCILSYLPFLSKNDYSNSSESKLFNCDKLIFKIKNIKQTKNIIDNRILYQELHEKQNNNSSFLIKLLIKLSSLFNENIFDFDLYLQKNEYRKIIKRWKLRADYFKIYEYNDNINKLVLLHNDFNINIIKIALNNLIPYFTDLMSSNFYLFLPEQFINMVKFFIKFLAYHNLIFNDTKSIKNAETKKLIQLFFDLNFKIIFDENTNSNFYNIAFENIKFLYNSLNLVNENLKNCLENDDEDEINIFNNKEIADFRSYIQKNDLLKLLIKIKYEFNMNNKLDRKFITEFILYFNPDILTNRYNKNDKNYMIPYITGLIKSNADSDDFYFKTFVVEILVKNKLITKIKKAENIINNYEQIDEDKKEKLKKYFILIIKILYFISNFIKNDDILDKYFNFYVDKNNSITQEIILNDESFISEKEKEKENKINIYCSFIYVAQLIIKYLLNNNFMKFIQKKINYLNKHDFKVKILVRESFGFLQTIFVTIPNRYENIIEKREKNKNKGKKRKGKKNEGEEKENAKELNEDLMNYYVNIINNIKVNDIMRLLLLLENNIIMRSSVEERKSQLRKIIKSLNEIETKYNLFPKESHLFQGSQDSNTCPICLDKDNDIHLNPCDHMFCYSCIQQLTDRRCPICRKTIIGVKEHPEFKFREPENNNNNDIIMINNRRVVHINNNRNPFHPNARRIRVIIGNQ